MRREKNRGRVQTYRCEYCGLFHTGNRAESDRPQSMQHKRERLFLAELDAEGGDDAPFPIDY